MSDRGLWWCLKQKNGISFIEPNKTRSKEYLDNAIETLEILKLIRDKSKMWLATTKYYCEYFSLYSLLMRIGIKCEIHNCSIKLCSWLEKEGIVPLGFSKVLEGDKQLRIDNQYYLKNKEVRIDYDELTQLILRMKDVNIKLSEIEIYEIRKKLMNVKMNKKRINLP